MKECNGVIKVFRGAQIRVDCHPDSWKHFCVLPQHLNILWRRLLKITAKPGAVSRTLYPVPCTLYPDSRNKWGRM
jgi:hypothetical protein